MTNQLQFELLVIMSDVNLHKGFLSLTYVPERKPRNYRCKTKKDWVVNGGSGEATKCSRINHDALRATYEHNSYERFQEARRSKLSGKCYFIDTILEVFEGIRSLIPI